MTRCSLFVLLLVGPGVAAAEVVPTPAAHPNAGFANEVFYLRSGDDNFILMPSGRFHYDWYGYQGGSREPANTFSLKRVRLEALGTFMKHWDFQLGAEFGSTSLPIISDAYVIANYTAYANVQLGQFDAPFTMENRTSDKWTDLQERSTVVRALAIPEGKEIGLMVFGQPNARWAYWSLGLFNGEGQNQLPHRSNRFDVMGRAWLAPFGLTGNKPLENAWVGGSFWIGDRQSSARTQVDRPAMKDAAGFTFFNTTAGTLHAGDQGALAKFGAELNLPIGQFVGKAEYVHVDEGIREVDTSAGASVRTAKLRGDGYYFRLSYFVWGDPLINGLGGMQGVPHLFGELKPGKTSDALQLVAEYDHTAFRYTPDDGADNDPFAGSYGLDTVGVGANYWVTKHVRLTGNFLYNLFSGAVATPLVSAQSSYELTFRVALAL